MATVRNSRPRVKPERRILLAVPPFEEEPGVLQIRVGKEEANYFLTPIPSDFGNAYRVEKIGGTEVYDVNLADGHGTCECKGFLRWNHCKHVDGLKALKTRGKL